METVKEQAPVSSSLEFENRLKFLLEERLELVPFHVCNVGPRVWEVKKWELLSIFSLLSPEKKDSLLCFEDTLGVLSFLFLPFCEVTYNSVKDSWDFAEKPRAKITGDLAHLPPKHPLLSKNKFDAILLFSLLDSQPPRRSPRLYAARRLLAPGGRIVASFTTCSDKTHEVHGDRQRVSPASWQKLCEDFRLKVEAREWLPEELTQDVAGNMCVVRLACR